MVNKNPRTSRRASVSCAAAFGLLLLAGCQTANPVRVDASFVTSPELATRSPSDVAVLPIEDGTPTRAAERHLTFLRQEVMRQLPDRLFAPLVRPGRRRCDAVRSGRAGRRVDADAGHAAAPGRAGAGERPVGDSHRPLGRVGADDDSPDRLRRAGGDGRQRRRAAVDRCDQGQRQGRRFGRRPDRPGSVGAQLCRRSSCASCCCSCRGASCAEPRRGSLCRSACACGGSVAILP